MILTKIENFQNGFIGVVLILIIKIKAYRHDVQRHQNIIEPNNCCKTIKTFFLTIFLDNV